jgi:TusE/DsrC/DsvC family sulfur relay protein
MSNPTPDPNPVRATTGDPAREAASLVGRLDALAAQVSYVAERQRAHDELIAELTPIAREAMAAAITRLDALDKAGSFAFLAELANLGQRIVEGFSPNDVRQLGDAVVGILDTVRALTQPAVLQIAADASAALHDADQVKPLGLFGLVRATKDADVQKGMAVMIEVLRRVGRGVNAVLDEQDKRLERKVKLAGLLGPRRGKALGIERRLPRGAAPARATDANRTRRPEPAAASAGGNAAPRAHVAAGAVAGPAAAGARACGAAARPTQTAAVIDGIAYGPDGHLVDPAAWSRPVAESIAHLEGVTLDDLRWAVIEAARAEFAATAASPNIRRLTQIAGVTTKQLYALFPRAPGRAIAKIAGLPKPAGCL